MHNQPREAQPYEDCQAKSIQENMRYCQKKNEKQETKKRRWAEGHGQKNLGFQTTSAIRRIEAVIKAKGALTKYWVHIQ